MGWLPVFVLALTLVFGPAQAREVVTDYDSQVVINPDGRLTVTETIRVIAEGRKIKRGIYRDIPLVRRVGPMFNARTGFHLVSLTRDGVAEPHHTERTTNGIRVYAGKANKFIAKGPHTYRFVFESTNQVQFFDEVDELYWNVTGNGWAFPIERVSATIVLPPGAHRVRHAPQGRRVKILTPLIWAIRSNL